MSTIKVTNIQATGETASRAVSGVAAAWLDFNHSTNTVDDSVNISSVTDDSTGKYVQNFSNNMASANYSMVGMARGYHLIEDTDSGSKAAASFKARHWYVSSLAGARTNQDGQSNSTAAFGDLA